MRKAKHCSLKVRSVYLLVILKMSKVTNFFNHIVMKILLEEMLNLMKISWPVSLIRHLCLLWPASLIWWLYLLQPTSHLHAFFPSSNLVSSSDDDSEDENPSLPTHPPPDASFELEPAPNTPLPRWVCSTQETTGDLVGDPSDQRQTHPQF
jgi:hypothetical protein